MPLAHRSAVSALIVRLRRFYAEWRPQSLACSPLSDEVLGEVDLVIALTDHSTIDYANVVAKAKHVLDTRNATKKVTENREKITLL